MRDLISISIAAISRYSAASSRLRTRISSTYTRYWRVTAAIGMSRMLKFCLRIRYSSRSSGPSNASRKTSRASGGMYRSVGTLNSGSPYRRAIATWSTTWGMAASTGAGASGSVAFRENEASDGKMYVLLEGAISLVRQGHELERVSTRGSAFGELALIDHLPRSATAVAQEPSKLVVLDEKGFRQQILGNPMF